MPKTATPDQLSKAIAMREAGYTTLAISQELGISVRSLQRHFAVHHVGRGTLKQEVVDAARSELMARIMSDPVIREEAAKLVADDLAHLRHLRGIILEASEKLQATSLAEAVLVMRAAAAYSTAVKNTSDMLRHTLRIENSLADKPTDTPELVVRELSQEEVDELRRDQVGEEVSKPQ